MIVRLAAVTALFGLFAVGFSELVEHDGRGGSGFSGQPAAGCYDQGAVCAPTRG